MDAGLPGMGLLPGGNTLMFPAGLATGVQYGPGSTGVDSACAFLAVGSDALSMDILELGAKSSPASLSCTVAGSKIVIGGQLCGSDLETGESTHVGVVPGGGIGIPVFAARSWKPSRCQTRLMHRTGVL
jgi:hypothetical protein